MYLGFCLRKGDIVNIYPEHTDFSNLIFLVFVLVPVNKNFKNY